jgi:exonuclease III
MFSWNVRGLINAAKQHDVSQVISSVHLDLVCLQETKLASIDPPLVRSLLGDEFSNNFMYLPASGTTGGIRLAARSSILTLSQPMATTNTISTLV